MATATEVRILIDNAADFAALRSALPRARRSIFIVGWEFDPRTRLDPVEETSSIGPLLNRLSSERPELEIRIVIWRAALGVAIGERLMPQRALRWFRSSGVQFRLDSTVPFGATHHQKLVVIDDELAFCSGDDLIVNRWDRQDHRDDDPDRLRPSGWQYEPRHGMSIAVSGGAARALGELARMRWKRATNESIPLGGGTGADCVRGQTEPDFTNVEVGISRTMPRWRREPEVRENEALYIRAVRSARSLLYFENQYFTSRVIPDELARRLAEPDGPEIIVITGEHAPSFFDRATMDAPRDALVHRLRNCDPYGRFQLYAPHAPEGRAVLVHSKLLIVDDRLVRIGSSNLSDRSLGYDSECDLSIEPKDAGGRKTITTLLHRLIAHFLGRRAGEVREMLAITGSVARTIAALDESRLRASDGSPPLFPKSLVAKFHIGDPLNSAEAWKPWRRLA